MTRLVAVTAEPRKVCVRTETKDAASVNAGESKQFRRLKWHELVGLGDFVADGKRGFELWEGPGGFRADSFVKPIYRRAGSPATGTKKSL